MVTQEQLTIEGADRPGVTAPQHQIYSAIREVLRVRIVFCDPNRALDSFILGRGRSPLTGSGVSLPTVMIPNCTLS